MFLPTFLSVYIKHDPSIVNGENPLFASFTIFMCLLFVLLVFCLFQQYISLDFNETLLFFDNVFNHRVLVHFSFHHSTVLLFINYSYLFPFISYVVQFYFISTISLIIGVNPVVKLNK